MWHVDLFDEDRRVRRRVIHDLTSQVEARQAAERLNVAYARVSPCANGFYSAVETYGV